VIKPPYFLWVVLILMGGQVRAEFSLGIDIGAIRNQYLVPNAAEVLVDWAPIGPLSNLTARLRLRSLNAVYFVSSAYDLPVYADYFLGIARHGSNAFGLAIGAGINARIRLKSDIRGPTQSSVEPMVALSPRLDLHRFKLRLPLWALFYRDGCSLDFQPELAFAMKRWELFFRFEWPVYFRYQPYYSEQTWDLFLGARYHFKGRAKTP